MALCGAALLSLSCDSANGPVPLGTSDLLVVSTVMRSDSAPLAVIEPGSGRITGHIGPLPRLTNRGALSPDHSTLYMFAELDNPTSELVAIDSRSLQIEWRMRIATLEQQALGDSLPIAIGGDIMSVTPDGKRLLLNATEENAAGFAIFDLSARIVTGFDPLVSIVDLASLAPSTDLPNGAVLVAGVRQVGPALYTGMFYVLDGATLAVRDSVTVTPPTDDPAAGMQQVLPSADGQFAYIVGPQQFRYDLTSRRLTDSTPTPSYGWLSMSGDGNTLYRSDFGTFDSPGSGNIFVYDADLVPRAPIDISQIAPSPDAPEQPVVNDNAATSPDGKLLYVAVGTPEAGGYGVYEPSRLLVIDRTTYALVRSISLAGSSPEIVLVR